MYFLKIYFKEREPINQKTEEVNPKKIEIFEE